MKLKSQALSLNKVNLAADHSIFFKLLDEITAADPETRSPINLRMRGFEVTCTYLAVIGKCFSESGPSDLVVEAGILDPSAVERAMNGKHYNNDVWAFKIVF